MKKTNFKNFLIILFTIVMVCVLCLSFVACDNNNVETPDKDDNGSDTATTSETTLIKNGTFATYTGSSAPFTAGTWKTSSSSSIKTNFKGVVHADDLFAAESATTDWANISNPGKANEDDEDSAVYMIYNVQEDVSTVYQSFTTAIGGYYKITVQFKAVGGVEDDLVDGAYITFSGNVYKQFGPFKPVENNGWRTVTLYVEASRVETQSITITMSMGDSKTSTKATGCVFFDNANVEQIQQSDYKSAQDTDGNELVDFYSMLTPDGDFINNMSVANPATSNTWSKNIGKDNEGNSVSTNYLQSGIVDIAKFDDWKSLIGEKEAESNVSPKTPYQFVTDNGTASAYDYLSDDTNLLLITNFPAIAKAQSNSSAYTAVGYSAKSSMAIEVGTYYELKVWVYTDLVNFDFDAENKVSTDPIDFGAKIAVTGVGENTYFENINTNKQWVEYTFAIVGHEYRTKSIGLELWLGNGEQGQSKLACGTVLFDNVRLIQKGTFTDSTRQSVIDNYSNVATANPDTTKVIDIKSLSDSSMTENTIKNPNFQTKDENGLPTDWTLGIVNDVHANISEGSTKIDNPDIIVDIINVNNSNTALEGKSDEEKKEYWQSNYGIDENPQLPYENLDNILIINNKIASAYQLKLPTNIEFKPNLQYRIGLWIKTMGVPEGTGATITLKNETADSTINSFTKVNTADYKNEITNGYAEYVFYVQGSNFVSNDMVDDTISASLTVNLGDGNALDSSAFVSGALLIANINIEQVNYSEYKKASSSSNSYVKTKSLATSQGTVSNGSFNSFEYDDSSIDPDTGRQTDFLKPSNWTLNSSLDKDDVKSGIVNTNQIDFINEKFGDNYQIYTNWATSDITKPVDLGKPNVLAIKAVNEIESSLVYTSSSVSLSKESFYVFKIYAMADGMVGTIGVTANNNSVPMYYKVPNDNAWHEIIFTVKTGSLASPSITIKLYAGDYATDSEADYEEGSEPKYQGNLFFDSITYYTVEEDVYNAANDELKSSYTVDSFDTTSKPTTVTGPSSSMWTGAGEKNSSSNNRANEEDFQYAGIIIKGSSEPDTFKKTEDVKYTDEEDGEEKTKVETIEGSVLTNEQIWVNDDSAYLMINNQKASYYSYKNKSSISLDSNSYYKLTVAARTIGIKNGEFATIKVENSKETFESKVNTEYAPKLDANGKIVYDEDGAIVYEAAASNDWTTYTFYFKTAESTKMSSVYITMLLGTSDAKVQGTVFFDNVELKKLDDATEFNNFYSSIYVVDEDGKATVDENGKYVEQENADKLLLTNKVIRADDDDAAKEEDKKDEEENTENKDTSYLWIVISSLVVAVVLIVAVIIYLVRKFVPKHHVSFKRKKKVEYSRDENGVKDTKNDVNDDSDTDFKD